MIKMTQTLMRERIQEIIAKGDDTATRQRVAVCLWGLNKDRDGVRLANELIDELGLEKYGAKKGVIV